MTEGASENITSILTGIGIELTVNGSSHQSILTLGGKVTAASFAFDFSRLNVGTLFLESSSGVFLRMDGMANQCSEALEISGVKQFFTFKGTGLSVTAQRSTWSREAQNFVLDLSSGEASIGSKGRSCSGFVPHFVIHSGNEEVAIDLLPVGDWRASFFISPDKSTLKVQIDWHEDFSVTIEPGHSLSTGREILISYGSAEQKEQSAVAVQSYALERLNKRGNATLPVLYNTWFDRYHKISWERLLELLDSAVELGCEVFVMDPEWCGPSVEDWISVGDWTENPIVFSEHRLIEFADLVRSKGLQFGIWMEPERVNPNAPVRIKHPEWFILSDSGMYYPDFSIPEACDWVESEITRVVETYGVKWLKVDCNFDFYADPHHTGHMNRLKTWYGIIERIAARFPDLIMEGCASGGLRSDLLTVSHFHTHFLSDTVDPVEIIRIGMSSLCRLAPRMTAKWAVMYPKPEEEHLHVGQDNGASDVVLCNSADAGATSYTYHLDFVAHAAMTGVMAISGDIAGLNNELQAQLADYIEFYKKHREFIQSSVGVPLTPDMPITNREGLAAIQLSDRSFEQSMIFVYNISLQEKLHAITPIGLDLEALYRVEDEYGSTLYEFTEGTQLLKGIQVECNTGRSCVLLINKLPV